MILGLSVSAFTTLHVTISLIAMIAGLLLMLGMVGGRHSFAVVSVFLATTILTSVTGYFFPTGSITPAQIVGAISLVALAVAVASIYWFELRGNWRPAFVVASALALYLNLFVGVVQAFQKLPPLARLAPTQSELPFILAQTAVLILLLVVGWTAVRRFKSQAPS